MPETEKYTLTYRCPDAHFRKFEFDSLTDAMNEAVQRLAAGCTRIWVWEPRGKNKKGGPAKKLFRHMPMFAGGKICWRRTMSLSSLEKYSEAAEKRAANIRANRAEVVARHKALKEAAANG